jgi:hypothetical protein
MGDLIVVPALEALAAHAVLELANSNIPGVAESFAPRIPVFQQMLDSSSEVQQECAAAAMREVAACATTRVALLNADCIPGLLQKLEAPTATPPPAAAAAVAAAAAPLASQADKCCQSAAALEADSLTHVSSRQTPDTSGELTGTQGSVLNLVCHLAGNAAGRQAVAGAGGVPVLVRLLGRRGCQAAAGDILCSLAEDEMTRQAVAGSAKGLVDYVRSNFTATPATILAVIKLAAHADTVEAVVEAGGATYLVTTLWGLSAEALYKYYGVESKNFMAVAARGVRDLAASAAGRRALAMRDGISEIKYSLQSATSTSADVIFQMLSLALTKLAADEACSAAVEAAGGLPPFLEQMVDDADERLSQEYLDAELQFRRTDPLVIEAMRNPRDNMLFEECVEYYENDDEDDDWCGRRRWSF